MKERDITEMYVQEMTEAVNSPKGRKILEEHFKLAEDMKVELDEARHISPEDWFRLMHTPMTI